MESLRDWRPGDSVRNNEHHQQAVRALRDLASRVLGPDVRQERRLAVRWGTIVNAGPQEEADYTDERYWVRLAYIKAAAHADPVELREDKAGRVQTTAADNRVPNIVTVKNVAERNPGGANYPGPHLLPLYKEVRIELWQDAGDPRNTHWLMNVEPRPVMKIVSSSEDGSTKRWAYTLKQVVKVGAGYGGWVDRTGALEYDGYNLLEDQNTGSTYGNGVPNPAPDGAEVVAVPTGARVECRLEWTATDQPELWFSAVNGLDVECP